jgi:hypothetical protein
VIEGEYVGIYPAPVSDFVCLRCGGSVPEIGQAVHTWNHRRLAGERDLGPRPSIG